jgi:hypothetical protein
MAEVSNDELLLLFQKHVIEAAKEASKQTIMCKPDWFTASEQNIMDLISIGNDELKKITKKGDSDSQELLEKAR